MSKSTAAKAAPTRRIYGAGLTRTIRVRVSPEQEAAWDALGPGWLREQLDREGRKLARAKPP